MNKARQDEELKRMIAAAKAKGFVVKNVSYNDFGEPILIVKSKPHKEER
jgi:hypothetical protein